MSKTEKIIIAVCVVLTLVFAFVGTRSYDNWKNKQQAAAQAAAIARDNAYNTAAAKSYAHTSAVNTELQRLAAQCRVGKVKVPALDCTVHVTD